MLFIFTSNKKTISNILDVFNDLVSKSKSFSKNLSQNRQGRCLHKFFYAKLMSYQDLKFCTYIFVYAICKTYCNCKPRKTNQSSVFSFKGSVVYNIHMFSAILQHQTSSVSTSMTDASQESIVLILP